MDKRATFVLIPGAGGSPWSWHLVVAELEARGHQAIAVDLPNADDSAGLTEYVDATVAAIGDRRNLVLVAHSMGAFTAPLVCERVPVDLMVLVAAMVPAPGERPGDWWANTDFEDARRASIERHGGDDSMEAAFLHDISPELVEESGRHNRDQSGTPFEKPWPLAAWPDVPTRFLLCRDDRFFPPEFLRRVVQDRLGFTPDEMGGGHLPMLARPLELTDWLERYLAEQRQSTAR
jgi:pimeloyl-ACP methyl ester carboxylesterase